MISIIIPALNEAATLERTLAAVMQIDGDKEVIVVDGGSDDATAEIAARCGAMVIKAERGRGLQMDAGASLARGDVLWFVHADSIPPGESIREIEHALEDPRVTSGNFSIVFEGSTIAARHLTWTYPRLRMLGLYYGDAGIFVRRSAYDEVGGFRPYPLFEDLDLVKRLKRHGRFVNLRCRLIASSRRFENKSYGRVWAIWIVLQLLFWFGVSPNRLARWYAHAR